MAILLPINQYLRQMLTLTETVPSTLLSAQTGGAIPSFTVISSGEHKLASLALDALQNLLSFLTQTLALRYDGNVRKL